MSEMNPGSVTVADLYREIVGMRGDLSRSLSKLEVIESRNTDADSLHRDHESRLRALEDLRPLAAQMADLEGRTRLLEKFRFQLAGVVLTLQVLAGIAEYLLVRK